MQSGSRITALALVLLVFIGLGCSVGQERPAQEWTAAYTADFQKAKVLENEWVPRWCEPKIADGKLILPAPERRGRVMACYDGKSFDQWVRVDMVASLTTKQPANRLNMGICLSNDGFDPPTGYLFQFGAKGNTCSLLKKETTSWDTPVQLGIHDGSHLNRPVAGTENNTLHPEPGKSYHLVAERDGNKLSFWVDDKLAFTYTDPSPIAGPERRFVSLMSQDCTINVEKFSVQERGNVAPEIGGKPFSKGPPFTLSGVVICSRVAAAHEDEGPHTLILYAYSGTPEIQADVGRIMKTYYPDGVGLDVDRAKKVQAEFDKNLRFSLIDCHLSRQFHSEGHFRAQIMAITGQVFERDGVNCIYPTSIKLMDFSPREMREDPNKRAFEYPALMVAPDKPFAMPGKTPLMLTISEALSLKCILLPAGSFIQGSPFYQSYRWQDEYPHEVVLTRPFYMAEHPITQEMFEAVTGKNPSKIKGAKFPVEKVAYKDILEFCRIVSEKTGRTVRLPTDAEWEYAARVGTSSPCITEKYLDQFSYAGDAHYGKPAPVKSRPPNAWGIYDMISCGWHVVSDYAANNVRTRQVDQKGPDRNNIMVRDYGKGPVHKAKGGEYYDDWRPSMHGATDEDGAGAEGNTIFNVVVEATPEEISRMR
jgi:hypothetical protein